VQPPRTYSKPKGKHSVTSILVAIGSRDLGGLVVLYFFQTMYKQNGLKLLHLSIMTLLGVDRFFIFHVYRGGSYTSVRGVKSKFKICWSFFPCVGVV